MNMQNLIQMFEDATGGTSWTRVILFIIVLHLVIPKTWIAIQSMQSPIWTPEDLQLLLMVFGAKLVQRPMEKPKDGEISPSA